MSTQSTVTLVDAPGFKCLENAPGSVYSLSSHPDIPSLTSLHLAGVWDENLVDALSIVKELHATCRLEDQIDFFRRFNMPTVDILRMRHFRILMETLVMVDLLKRLSLLLKDREIHELRYFGPEGWRPLAIASLCTKNNIKFRHLKVTDKKAVWKNRLRFVKNVVFDWRDWISNKKTLRQNSTYDYLALCTSMRNLLTIGPILENLAASSIVVEERAGPLSASLDRPTLHLEGFTPSCRLTAQKRERLLRSHLAGVLRQKPIIWRNIELSRALASLINQEIEGATLHIMSMVALLARFPQSAIIGTHATEPLIEVARAMGRHATIIQTGGSCEYEMHMTGAGRYVVASQVDADYMVQCGVKPEDISVIGHAYYDSFLEQDWAAIARKTKLELAIPEAANTIVLADNYPLPGLLSPETREQSLRIIYHGLKDVPSLYVVVKKHPFEASDELHEALAQEAGIDKEKFRIVRTGTIAPLIAASDLMIMMGSAVAQESILLDKPVVDVPFSATDYFGYYRHGAVLVAHNSTEVRTHVLAVLEQRASLTQLAEGREKLRQSYFPNQNGNVAQNIAKLLEDNLIQQNKALN